MKQYRPNVERQKWLYSMEKAREFMRRRRMEGKIVDPNRIRIPDNSEPWLPGGVKSVADALWISDQIAKDIQRWRINPPQTDSFAN